MNEHIRDFASYLLYQSELTSKLTSTTITNNEVVISPATREIGRMLNEHINYFNSLLTKDRLEKVHGRNNTFTIRQYEPTVSLQLTEAELSKIQELVNSLEDKGELQEKVEWLIDNFPCIAE